MTTGAAGVLITGVLLLLAPAGATAQHGIALNAGCRPTTCVGQPLLCQVTVTRNDQCGDAIELHPGSHAHVADPGHVVPLPLWIIGVQGNTTAIANTPFDSTIVVGPPGDTNFGLPGDAVPGSVVLGFTPDQPGYMYIVQPDQVGFLQTTFHVLWQDLCDSWDVDPPCQDCPLGIEFEATAGAVTNVRPQPGCEISGPPLVCPGAQGVEYTATETSEPPIAGATFDWQISGNALFCDGSNTATGSTVCVNADPACDGSFVLSVTVTTPDGCTNTCSYTVAVRDDEPPEITCAPDATIECPATPEFAPPTVSDACDPEPAVTFSDETTPGDCPQEYSITRTWTATDACGNPASCSQTITVRDTTPPEITCAPDATIECPATPEFAPPTVSDACDPEPAVTFSDETTPGDCPQEYSITRTWTATDACGNSASCSQTITVRDTTAPTLEGCPTGQELECDVPYEFTVTCSDDCGECQAVCELTFVDPPGAALFEDLGGGTYRITFSASGSATITCTALDACGNSATCAADLTARCAGGEGCTPGYWKQPHHFGNWTPPYTPDTLFGDVFEDAFPGKTLLQVLSQGGGGLNALGRHTVAALLNAASPDVNYDLTPQEVIDLFNAVFPGSKDDYEALKDLFEEFNEQGCPLGRSEAPAAATATPAIDR